MNKNRDFETVALCVVCNSQLLPIRIESKLWPLSGNAGAEPRELDLGDNVGPRALALLILAAQLPPPAKSVTKFYPILSGTTNQPASSLFNAISSYNKGTIAWFNTIFGNKNSFDRFCQRSIKRTGPTQTNKSYNISWQHNAICKISCDIISGNNNRRQLTICEILEGCHSLVKNTQKIQLKGKDRIESTAPKTWHGYNFPYILPPLIQENKKTGTPVSLSIFSHTSDSKTRLQSGMRRVQCGEYFSIEAKFPSNHILLHWISIPLKQPDTEITIHKLFPEPDEDLPPTGGAGELPITFKLETFHNQQNLNIPLEGAYPIDNIFGFEICVMLLMDEDLPRDKKEEIKGGLFEAASKFAWSSPLVERISSSLPERNTSPYSIEEYRISRPKTFNALALKLQGLFYTSEILKKYQIELIIIPVGSLY